MSRSLMSVKKVALSLHVSTREVVRMAEHRILPGTKIRGQWQFRTGDIWNWIEENMHALPARRLKDRHPETTGGLLITTELREIAVTVDLVAKTKSSVLRKLAKLAEAIDPFIDAQILAEKLIERESQGTTALQDGVAVPHSPCPLYSEGTILAAARTSQGIVFGERGGGLTDLFFLVCCPDQADHLLHLGRLCRLLIDRKLQEQLRQAADAAEFVEAIRCAEEELCQTD